MASDLFSGKLRNSYKDKGPTAVPLCEYFITVINGPRRRAAWMREVEKAAEYPPEMSRNWRRSEIHSSTDTAEQVMLARPFGPGVNHCEIVSRMMAFGYAPATRLQLYAYATALKYTLRASGGFELITLGEYREERGERWYPAFSYFDYADKTRRMTLCVNTCLHYSARYEYLFVREVTSRI